MANINKSILFNPTKRDPLDRISKESTLSKLAEQNLSISKNTLTSKKSVSSPTNQSKLNSINVDSNIQQPSRKADWKQKTPGRPKFYFDQILKASKPIKLSPFTDSTIRKLNSIWMTDMTKEQIVRKCIDSYINQNFTKEDRQALYDSVFVEMRMFRHSHPSENIYDEKGTLIKSSLDIDSETEKLLKKNWNI